jgi:hypothetical protein
MIRTARAALLAAALATAPALVVPAAAQQPQPQQQGAGQPAAADVAWAKEVLRAVGFDAGRADAAVTPLFTRRLREYQQARGLPVTGRLDQATSRRLLAEAPQRRSSNTITFGNQGVVLTPEQQRAAQAPASPPPAPRAAPREAVQAERSTADPAGIAVLSRGGAAQPGAPAAGPGAASSAQPPAAGPAGSLAAAASRIGGAPAADGAPAAAPPVSVEVGQRAEGVLTREEERGETGFPPRWLGWVGAAGLVGFFSAFGLVWWRAGVPKRPMGSLPRAGRKPPRFGAPRGPVLYPR